MGKRKDEEEEREKEEEEEEEGIRINKGSGSGKVLHCCRSLTFVRNWTSSTISCVLWGSSYTLFDMLS